MSEFYKEVTEYPVCPLCHGWIPNNQTPGAYPGAISRRDNKTEICSACGTYEALVDHVKAQREKALSEAVSN